MFRLSLILSLGFLSVVGCGHIKPAPQLRTSPLPREENRTDEDDNFSDDNTTYPPLSNHETETDSVADLYEDVIPELTPKTEPSRGVPTSDHAEEELWESSRPVPRYQLSREDVRAMALRIRDFLGAPYVWGGSSPEGTDCSGFIYAVYRDVLGIDLPRSAAHMYSVGMPVTEGTLRFADLVFFREYSNSGVTHVGIYIARAKFVHASPTKGVMISSLEEKFHRDHYAGARRIVGRAGR